MSSSIVPETTYLRKLIDKSIRNDSPLEVSLESKNLQIQIIKILKKLDEINEEHGESEIVNCVMDDYLDVLEFIEELDKVIEKEACNEEKTGQIIPFKLKETNHVNIRRNDDSETHIL